MILYSNGRGEGHKSGIEYSMRWWMYASIIIHAQGFDLNVDLHLVHVDDVVAPTITLRDSKRHAS